MKSLKPLYLGIGAVAAVALAPMGSAQAATEFGVLKCETNEETRKNYVVRSTADVTCVFERRGGGTEKYIGESGIAAGLTLTFAQESQKLSYAVAANTTTLAPGALAGKFTGAQGDVAIKKGAGGAILIGGGNNQLSLSPMGLTQEGYGASAGIGFLHLQLAN